MPEPLLSAVLELAVLSAVVATRLQMMLNVVVATRLKMALLSAVALGTVL